MVLLEDISRFAEPEESQTRSGQTSLMEKHRIPVQHFEYSYIETCNDGRELEKIVQILQSGEEGYFPDLTRFAENRLSVIKPKSKLLQTVCPVLSKEALSTEERNELTNDLTQWVSSVSKDDNELVIFKNRKPHNSALLPDVREAKESIIDETKSSTKRISSTDYSSWDKYDVDAEILKMDLEEEKLKKTTLETEKKKRPKKTVQFKEFTTDIEAIHEANYERNKGNEFFRAGDYMEALRHYTNSINFKPTLQAFTNRALTHNRLKNYKNAVDDCNSALMIDQDCVTAYIRKAQALFSLKQPQKALNTIEHAIQIEPNHALAQQLAEKFRDHCGATLKNTRFTIQDVDNDAFKSCLRNDRNEIIIPIPGPSNMPPPFYITCRETSPERIQEEINKVNSQSQLVHMVTIDNSEDDDNTTNTDVENLLPLSNNIEDETFPEFNQSPRGTHKKMNRKYKKKWPKHGNKPRKKSEDFLAIYGSQNNDESDKTASPINTNATDITKNVTQVVEKDKHAGGEPYINENEQAEELTEDLHSPYNFLKAWNSANSDDSLVKHASILRRIDMHRIVDVIGCKLDNDMFSAIIKCLCVHFAVPGEVDRLHYILDNIVNLPRFGIISMLMSSEDINSINVLINFLKQHGKFLSEDVINKFLNH